MMFWMRRSVSKNLIGILLFLIITLALVFILVPILRHIAPPLFGAGHEFDDLQLKLLQYQHYLYLAPLIATILTARFYDRMPLEWTGLGMHRWMWREIGIGALLGIIMAAVAWLPLALTGGVRSEEIGSFGGLLLWGTILLANAAGEEILFRGYLYQRIVEIVGPVAGTLLVSGGFAAAHLSNPGISEIAVVNIFLAGLLFSTCLLVTGSLWTSIALHSAWNIALALGFGVPMSGLRADISLLHTDSTGHIFLTGGPFGPEGSLITTGVLLLAGGGLVPLSRLQFSPYTFSRIFWGFYRQKMRKFRPGTESGTPSKSPAHR